MNELEQVLYCIAVVAYGVLCYAVGKGDLLNLVALMLQEKTRELEKRLEGDNGEEI